MIEVNETSIYFCRQLVYPFAPKSINKPRSESTQNLVEDLIFLFFDQKT